MSSKFLDKTGLDTLWAKIKSTFQTLGNLVTTSTGWSSTPSDTKYPSEKLVKTSLDAKAADSAVLHKAGLETASGQKWFEGGFCVFNTSNVGYGHYTLPATSSGTKYDSWPEEYKDGAHFREWSLSFNTGINFWGKIRITIATSYSSFNASGSMQKTINCAFNKAEVFNNTGYYNDLGINSEKEFRISDLIWNNTTACWEIKIHSIKPTSNNSVPVLLIEFWTYSTSNRASALGIHWVSTSPSIVTDTTYYTKRSGNASTSPGTSGEQFNWADTPVQQSPYGYEIFNRSHTIPVANGGTGKTSVTAGNYLVGNGTSALTEKTPKQVGNNVLPALDAGGDNVLDTDYIIASNHTSGATDTTAFVRRTADKLWNYIKGEISSVLGLTATSYGGNAATATTASTAAGYTSGGAIDTALQVKATPADIASAIQALDVASQGGDGKYIKAISEADGKISATAETMDTAPTAGSTKAVTSGGVKTALDGKQDALGISSSGDAGKFLNEKGNWETPAGVTGVKGYAESSYRTGNVNITSQNIGLGTCYDLQNTQAIQFSIGAITNYGSIKFFASVGSFVIEFTVTIVVDTAGSVTESPSVTMVACRQSGQTLSSSNFVPAVKYLSGDLENDVPAKLWIYFGSGNVKRIRWIAATQNYTKITSSLVTIASIDSSATMVASTAYSYTPLVTGGYNKAVGSNTKPVYVDTNGLIKECKQLVRAVTSINTSNMDPEVLYVM